jgi:hypothetical protein
MERLTNPCPTCEEPLCLAGPCDERKAYEELCDKYQDLNRTPDELRADLAELTELKRQIESGELVKVVWCKDFDRRRGIHPRRAIKCDIYKMFGCDDFYCAHNERREHVLTIDEMPKHSFISMPPPLTHMATRENGGSKNEND